MFGKFNIADALRQYGINPCTIVEGRNADAQFPFSDWNKEQLKQVNHLVDHIYSGFVQKVSPHFQMHVFEITTKVFLLVLISEVFCQLHVILQLIVGSRASRSMASRLPAQGDITHPEV